MTGCFESLPEFCEKLVMTIYVKFSAVLIGIREKMMILCNWRQCDGRKTQTCRGRRQSGSVSRCRHLASSIFCRKIDKTRRLFRSRVKIDEKYNLLLIFGHFEHRFVVFKCAGWCVLDCAGYGMRIKCNPSKAVRSGSAKNG